MIPGALGLALLLGAASASSAAIRPFVYGGGQSIRIASETTNELLDPITLRHRVRTWQLGAGLRVFPGSGRADAAERSRWEFRFRYGRGAGDLPDNTIRLVHEARRNPYDYSVSERYDHSYSVWGLSFLARLLPHVAAYIGPSVQTVTYEGRMSVTGDLPDPAYRGIATSGKDKEVVRYGVVDLGLQLTPKQGYPALDLHWAPARFDLSTTRRSSLSGWQGTFPDMDASFGVGLAYDFTW